MNDQPLTDILDIAGNIRTPWPDRFYAAAFVLLGVCLLFILFKSYRWYQQRFAKKKVQLPAFEQALLDLKKLTTSSDSTFDEKYLHLTEILKRFVTEDLNVNWHDKTFEEIRQNFPHFRKCVADDIMEDQILNLLERSEGIKFAKVASQQEVFFNDVQFAERVVQHCHKRQVPK